METIGDNFGFLLISRVSSKGNWNQNFVIAKSGYEIRNHIVYLGSDLRKQEWGRNGISEIGKGENSVKGILMRGMLLWIIDIPFNWLPLWETIQSMPPNCHPMNLALV